MRNLLYRNAEGNSALGVALSGLLDPCAHAEVTSVPRTDTPR
jgi:hypothetical protein